MDPEIMYKMAVGKKEKAEDNDIIKILWIILYLKI